MICTIIYAIFMATLVFIFLAVIAFADWVKRLFKKGGKHEVL